MNSNPEVEIVLACAYGDVGQRLRPNGTLRDWLVGHGFAKIVKPAAAGDEAADPARPAKFAQKAKAKLLGGLLGG
jgi:hypothetical protein